jgi:outer membrane immunogenic protein
MRVKVFCGLLASIAAGAGSAVAADMPVRPPPVAAPAVAPCCAVPDWVGFYVGVHGGGGWGRKDFEPGEFETGETDFIFSNASPKGGVFGFQFGHNWQWGPVVGGLEIDFSGADIKESTTFFFVTPAGGIGDTPAGAAVAFTRDVKIDSLASARGRLGWLLFPNLLAYGTAGIGWGHQRLTTTETTLTTFETNTTFTNEFGWVAGVGLEWKFINNWLLRGEWLHYDFGRTTHPDASLADENLNVRTTVDVARAALSYKF